MGGGYGQTWQWICTSAKFRKHVGIATLLITGAVLATSAVSADVALRILNGCIFVASIATLYMFAHDKFNARTDSWRFPEKTLLCGALCFGLLGAWAGMLLCAHKVRNGTHGACDVANCTEKIMFDTCRQENHYLYAG
jgi:uncharacterized membrane protein YsdA (DUF1294 family)